MDVERIQKINNLALDLMKQGLAADREDAIAQAEKIFSGKDSEPYNEMRETLQEIKEDRREDPVVESTSDPASELSQDQIKNILEQNTKFLVKTIKEFHVKMDEMKRDMASLKTKMNYKELPTVKDIVKEPIKEINLDEEAAPVAVVENVAPKKENHPRVGRFEDVDVSIEKFFYMGNKWAECGVQCAEIYL